MRDYGKYMDYNSQLSATRSVLASCSGEHSGGCSSGAHNAVNSLNAKADAFTSSTSLSASQCTIYNTYLICNAASYTYPSVDVVVNTSFLGGPIYTPVFNMTASNIYYTVKSR